ncbi:UNVERIFIED_CONTAM: hypothetical protein RMT77_012272 [Armadillidium vulgare]
MEPSLVLTLLSGAMLIGCYLAGSIPLAVSMSEDRMEVVTVLGAGLLVGTALTVIIPEGVNTLLASHEVETNTSKDELKIHSHSAIEPHNIIGISLLLGFLLMLMIDQCAGSHHKSADPEMNNSRGGRAPWMATLGLVVHAAADGIALGAAVSSSHTDVEVIVFFAIMLHKAPAAFGLVTFLLHENLEVRRIKRHLLLFALAAPFGAFLTYLAITQSGSATLTSAKNAGIAMLFSAGTFLYVSTVHVLPELTDHHSHSSDGTKSSKQFSRKQLLALIVGSLLPLVLTFGHHH